MISKLIRCSECNQVIPNYAGTLTQTSLVLGVEWSGADLTEAKEFLAKHSGHRLEQLSVQTDSAISEKPVYEPFGVTYIMASNPHGKFLIRRSRMALDEPASYKIIPGELKMSNVSLKIQEYDLRKQIAGEKQFSLLLKRKMEKFIDAFRDEVAGIRPADFDEEAEGIDEGETSLIAYGGLNDSRWERILSRSGSAFKVSELDLVRRFIEENRVPPEVLSVQIQRRISIIQFTAKEPTSIAQAMEEEKASAEDQSDVVVERKAAIKKG